MSPHFQPQESLKKTKKPFKIRLTYNYLNMGNLLPNKTPTSFLCEALPSWYKNLFPPFMFETTHFQHNRQIVLLLTWKELHKSTGVFSLPSMDIWLTACRRNSYKPNYAFSKYLKITVALKGFAKCFFGHWKGHTEVTISAAWLGLYAIFLQFLNW